MQKNNFPNSLSLILPLYNEAVRFPEHFDLLKKLHEGNKNWEIILVNDGSSDETEEIVSKKIKAYDRMKLISYQANQGKGYAIKQGVNTATKDLILFSDIDFSTPITELELFLPFMEKNADIVIGTRKVQGATITRHQPGLREWLGKRFTQLSNMLLGLEISDFTCGFKLFKKKPAQKIFSKIKVKGWGFDSEILYLAHKYDYKIVEVPVVWQNDLRTKVNLARDIYRSLSDLVKIRFNDARGKYD